MLRGEDTPGLALAGAGFLFFAVALSEWRWRAGHAGHHGVSGYVIALGVGGLGVCCAVGLLIRRLNAERVTAAAELDAAVAAFDARVQQLEHEAFVRVMDASFDG